MAPLFVFVFGSAGALRTVAGCLAWSFFFPFVIFFLPGGSFLGLLLAQRRPGKVGSAHLPKRLFFC
jgi:hypothetical protein